MKTLTTSPTLFGVDLTRIGQHWKLALQDMARWPVLRWLSPRLDVHVPGAHGQPPAHLVIDPQGLARLHAGQSSGKLQAPKLAQAADRNRLAGNKGFQGRLVPADILLGHSFEIPILLPEQVQAAAELEIQRLSPFSAEDQIVAWHAQPLNNQQQRLTVLITSRPLISRTLPDFDAGQHELWAALPGSEQFILLPGFGEGRRLRAQRSWRWGLGLLVVSMVLALGALAATPTVQQHLRAQEGRAALAASTQRAAPATRAREDMLTQQQRVKDLENLVSQRLVPEYTLLLLTRYLPDDTYVISLDLSERQIQLSGLTPNAAAFMTKLGAQPGISKVTAVHAARRENSRPGSREIFTIEFTLEAAAAMAGAALAATPAEAVAPPKTTASEAVSTKAAANTSASKPSTAKP